MGRKMTRLCTICARGGSKGVKNKNIRDLHGKPLIAYSILRPENVVSLIALQSVVILMKYWQLLQHGE